jgi:DEAD/DEAH box helicase domain-containing protein
MEADLHSGALTALAATNALELGIDVGSLDLTLHLGFPGSVSSLWQQSGRAGRREQHSVSLLVGFDGPLDQHFMRHPGELFGRPIECALVSEAGQGVDEFCEVPVVHPLRTRGAAGELPLHIFAIRLAGAISRACHQANSM